MRTLGRLGVAISLGIALLAAACGEETSGASADCKRLWEEAQTCYDEYCIADVHNRLLCDCIDKKQSLNPQGCECSGRAEDSFLDSCRKDPPPEGEPFDCEQEVERLDEKSALSGCCLETADCTGGRTCVEARCE